MPQRLLLCLLLAFAAATSPASAASIWTEVPPSSFSPATTATITAIEYQSADRFWLTTSDGAIYRRDAAGTFVREHSPSGVPLNDIEFQRGGFIGLAVGNGGQVLRSTDNGNSWAAVSGIPVSDDSSTFVNCKESRPLGDVNSVRFAGDHRAWIFATGSQVARSQPANATQVGATGEWMDANRNTNGTASPDDDTCKLPSTYGDGYADGFFVPTNPDVGYIVAASFSEVFFTSNSLLTAAAEKPASAGNAGGVRRTLAGDPGNPARMWATGPEPYGRSVTAYTQDGWATEDSWNIGNPDSREFPNTAPWDVDFAGGTVLAAGDAGMVLNSIDGATFYYNPADGALATHDWRAVSLASASDGAIGGIAGKLALTTAANTIPDIVAPTGSIGGPSAAQAGQPVSLTASVADNEGGSGVDAPSLQWTVDGFSAQTGTTATYTFPNSGVYTVRLTFRDRAGNAGTATKSISVSAAPAPPPAQLPVFTLPPAAKPPISGGGARRKGKYVTIRVRGRFKVPPGLSAAQACKGSVFIRVIKGKRLLVARVAKLSSTCGYRKRIRVARRKVGRAKRLTLVVGFSGNGTVGAAERKYTVRVRR